MFTRNQAIEIVNGYLAEEKNERTSNSLKAVLEKLHQKTDEEFEQMAIKTLGKECEGDDFKDWLKEELKEHAMSFIKLNDFVSYHIEKGLNVNGENPQNTIVLHIVPQHVTYQQIRDGGAYLVDALEKIKAKIKDGEIQNANSVFAVSDILRMKRIQEYFKRLGFEVQKCENERAKAHFKDPYQASLSQKVLMSNEWEELKNEFMKDRQNVEMPT